MPDLSVRELARHINRMRRRTTPLRPGVVVRDITGGWLSARPGGDPGAYPSSSLNRVYWMDVEGTIGPHEVEGALSAGRELGLRRMYAWVAPWAWDETLEWSLGEAGAAPWPDLAYVALARRPGTVENPRPCGFTVRVLGAHNIEAAIRPAASWYSEEGIQSAIRLVREGISEVYAAFEGDSVVALATLTPDSDWAYLGAAGTDPAKRGQGAQTALIASRLERAAALGIRWCAAETNTAVPISLRNLKRCGFEEAVHWRVYSWDLPGAVGSGARS
jgi:GNAT superfamily N-acetyltransferase